MLIRILLLLTVLIILIILGYFVLRRRIKPYHVKTWAAVEFFWYCISFAAVCIGLFEIERLERLDSYTEQEKLLRQDYNNKRNLLHAQTWLLKLDGGLTPSQEEGARWFHKMKALFDEGLYTSRWEDFLIFSRSYILKEKGVYADVTGNASEFGWPRDTKADPDKLFLREEIVWVVDSLKSFQQRKAGLINSKPEENTNYRLRYYLIFFFLAGLSLKMLKIYADYVRISNR